MSDRDDSPKPHPDDRGNGWAYTPNESTEAPIGTLIFRREAGNNEEAFWEACYIAALGHVDDPADALEIADRSVIEKRRRRGPSA